MAKSRQNKITSNSSNVSQNTVSAAAILEAARQAEIIRQQELLKQKYRNLVNNLNAINSKFNELNSLYNNMVNEEKTSFTIDNKIVDEEVQININNNIQSIIGNLGNTISSASGKC